MNLNIAEELCKRFEGLARVGQDGMVYPYICPAGFPTQGYGTVFRPDGRKVTMDDPPITRQVAEEWLKLELLHTYAPGVARLCPILLTHPRRFNAIVDFCYNLGVGRLQTSTLRRKINAQDWEGAVEQILLWNKAGGRILPGLERRCQARAVLMR